MYNYYKSAPDRYSATEESGAVVAEKATWGTECPQPASRGKVGNLAVDRFSGFWA